MVKNLKRLRARAGVSQKKLADAVNVSQQSVNKYENHDVEPDIETLVKLADYFNTSVDFLIGRTEYDRPVERTERFDLNPGEAALVEAWRKLNSGQKESIQMVISNYIESN